MVNWRIRLSRSLAAVCCREMFKDRWDWIAVCWIWIRIFGFGSFQRIGKRDLGESEPFSACRRIMWSWSTEGTEGSRSDQYSPVDARHLPLGGLGLLAWVTCGYVLCWWLVFPRRIGFFIFFFLAAAICRGFDVTQRSVRSSREDPLSPSCCCRLRLFKSLGRPTLNPRFLVVSFCSYLNDRVRVCPDATVVSLHDTVVAE